METKENRIRVGAENAAVAGLYLILGIIGLPQNINGGRHLLPRLARQRIRSRRHPDRGGEAAARPRLGRAGRRPLRPPRSGADRILYGRRAGPGLDRRDHDAAPDSLSKRDGPAPGRRRPGDFRGDPQPGDRNDPWHGRHRPGKRPLVSLHPYVADLVDRRPDGHPRRVPLHPHLFRERPTPSFAQKRAGRHCLAARRGAAGVPRFQPQRFLQPQQLCDRLSGLSGGDVGRPSITEAAGRA